MTKPKALVFDVNETLLDLWPLRADFEVVFGIPAPLAEWFARLLHGSLVSNHLNSYRPFGVIGVEALLAIAERRGIDIGEHQATALVAAMAELPAHPDVIPALERLVDAGYHTATLTNGSTTAANAQIENAGLHVFINRVISVDEVRRFKPDPVPYLHAAQVMGVKPEQMMFIAAHDWDVAGAQAVGARAAFVKREGSMWTLPGDGPELEAADLIELADALVT